MLLLFFPSANKHTNIASELCVHIAYDIYLYQAFHFCVLFQTIWSLSTMTLLLLPFKDIPSTETPLFSTTFSLILNLITLQNLTPQFLEHHICNNFPSSLFWRASVSWHLKNNLKYFYSLIISTAHFIHHRLFKICTSSDFWPLDDCQSMDSTIFSLSHRLLIISLPYVSRKSCIFHRYIITRMIGS